MSKDYLWALFNVSIVIFCWLYNCSFLTFSPVETIPFVWKLLLGCYMWIPINQSQKLSSDFETLNKSCILLCAAAYRGED